MTAVLDPAPAPVCAPRRNSCQPPSGWTVGNYSGSRWFWRRYRECGTVIVLTEKGNSRRGKDVRTSCHQPRCPFCNRQPVYRVNERALDVWVRTGRLGALFVPEEQARARFFEQLSAEGWWYHQDPVEGGRWVLTDHPAADPIAVEDLDAVVELHYMAKVIHREEKGYSRSEGPRSAGNYGRWLKAHESSAEGQATPEGAEGPKDAEPEDADNERHWEQPEPEYGDGKRISASWEERGELLARYGAKVEIRRGVRYWDLTGVPWSRQMAIDLDLPGPPGWETWPPELWPME